MPKVHVRRDTVLGDLPTAVYGHFTEHLAHIMVDGLWSELLLGRKFEAPMVGRVPKLAEPWEPFGGLRDDHTHYRRGPDDMPRFASPQGKAHHCQGVVVDPGNDGAERGIAQGQIVVDAGVTYDFRGSVRRLGPAGTLKVALRASDGVTVLAETTIDIPPLARTRFGDEFAHNALWMDDISWVEVDARLTPTTGDADGVFTLTFIPATDEQSLWHFNWVSLMPSDNIDGWEGAVVEGLTELPAQSLKWPGGCMADDYDWRYGLGPRDDRYGTVDQAWATWDENDVGIDEFMRLCELTGAEPIMGVNGGTGTPEMAAQWVEYCNGSIGTEWGARRAANGHAAPYDVRTWVVGNEQWGFFETGYVGPELYADRYLAIADAMRKVDPTITMVAVGQVGEFNRIVLRKAAHAIDQLQIHAYTPDAGPAVTDGPSATHKIATAEVFDGWFEQCRQDIASVPGAEHVKVCLDEWGWSRGTHAGTIFTAACLNAMHRAAPLVRVGSKAAVINVDGVLNRRGQTVVRTGTFDVFRAFNEAHLPESVAVEVSGEGEQALDVSALVDGNTGACSIFLVNRAPMPVPVELDAGVAAGTPVRVTVVQAADASDPAGASRTSRDEGAWTTTRPLPPHSLTVIQIGAPQ